jgi:preprotein translocase subunit SecD
MKKWTSVLCILFVSVISLADSNPLGKSDRNPQLTIEVRPVVEGPGSNSVEMKTEDGSVFHVAKKALLTEKDISDASVTPAEDQSTLNMSLKAAGSKEMKQFTSTHVGNKLALVVNGELVKTPAVKMPIKDGKVVISFMSEDQALTLARAINLLSGR